MLWIRFFFGTPRRLLVTLGVVALIGIFSAVMNHVAPGLLQKKLQDGTYELINGLWPLVKVVMYLAFVYLAYRMLLYGVTGGRRNNRRQRN